MTAVNPIVNLITQAARRRGVDPAAALAVASVEGGLRPGAVGDQGTSYGPFQLHVGGALPRGRGPGWASSPAGIEYALNQIAGVSRGLTGRAAVEAIVRRFERPADPGSEIQRALGHYGRGGTGVPGGTVAAGGLPGASTGISAGLLGVLNSNNELLGLPAMPLSVSAPTLPPAASTTGGKSAKVKRGRTIRYLEHFAAPFGVTVTSTTSGKHVKGSYHYKGRAVDFSGTPAQMIALARAALAHPEQFREMFYDPLGLYVKDGRVIRGRIGGHSDHVHLAR